MHKMGASKRFADKSKESFPSISINRHEEAYLSEQVAESLRTAIRTGFYRAGDALPPLRTIMKKAGVSLRVAREAMRRLADRDLDAAFCRRAQNACMVGCLPWSP